MLARRAEALLMEEGAPHSSHDPLANSSGTPVQRRGKSDATRLEHLATLSSSFAQLRVYNPRLMEVVQCSLAPAVLAATQQLSESAVPSESAQRGTYALLSERALGNFCWSVGRLGPPLPELHASIGTLSCAALPHVSHLDTLAKVSWWSAVMQGLDSAGPVKIKSEHVDRHATAHLVPAAVTRRLAELVGSKNARQREQESYMRAKWDVSASSALWGLACHDWQDVDFLHTFWAVLGPESAADIHKRSIAVRCRLHQCLIEIQTNAPSLWSLEAGWQAKIAANCHQAFLDSAKKATQHETRTSSAVIEDTMQKRVGQMLRRATESVIEKEVVLPSGYTVDLLVRPELKTRSCQHAGDQLIAVEVLLPTYIRRHLFTWLARRTCRILFTHVVSAWLMFDLRHSVVLPWRCGGRLMALRTT
eukprot:COSAG02_NODE_6509_length_3529_cov_2.283673_2_plen_420_part_00